MSLPQKPALKAPGSAAGTGPAPPPHPAIRALPSQPPQQIQRGPVQQSLDDRIFTPSAVSAVYSTTPYASGQNAAATTLVYSQAAQPMTTQPQNRSPFAAGPRPAHHQFFQRPQIQPPRATIQNSSPSIRPGAQTPTAVYQTNQHIMMVNHLPMPYAMPQGPQYCLPQYRHSTSPYVGPPQQYPVQPPGPGPFYPGPGPGEFPNTYGPPFYPSQPVYPTTPIIVPTPQQPPPAKREKKTIRIRDPNQGGKDITEEIMSGGGGSRNPTPPIGRSSSTPTPPQQLSSQVPEPGPVVYRAVESEHIAASTSFTATSELKQEEKPKQDPVLKSPPVLRPQLSTEEKDQTDQIPAAAYLETKPELPLPPLPAATVSVSTTVASTTIAPAVAGLVAPIAVPSKPTFPTDSVDRCDFTASKEEKTLSPEPVPCRELPQPAVADEPKPDICKEPIVFASSDILVTVSPNLIKEVNGLSDQVIAMDSVLEIVVPEEMPLTVKSEVVEVPRAEVTVENTPSSITFPTPPSVSPSPPPHSPSPSPPPVTAANIITTTPSPSPPPVQEDLEEEKSTRTSLSDDKKEVEKTADLKAERQPEESMVPQTLNSRKSPVQVLPTITAPKTWKKPKDGTRGTEDVLEVENEPKVEEEFSGDRVLESEQDPSHGFQPEKDLSDVQKTKAMEENGEQEVEPVHNGTENLFENEGADANSGSTEGSEDGLIYQYKPGGNSNEQLQGASHELQPTPVLIEQWKPQDHEGKKQYDRDFLLGFQFMPACIQKPEGLPPISDVVLDKINQPKLPQRTLDPRILQRGPDFTPAFADFSRPSSSGRGMPLLTVGPRRTQPGQRREPRKIIMNISVGDDVHLKKAENAWKPSLKRDSLSEDPENVKTQELFRKVRSILNKLTPQMFNQLMKQVTDLTVDTEERLKGVIDLVFEKAIDEPSFSVAYGNMCRCLATLKVPMADKPGNTVNFRKLLLNRCQKEFEKDKADDDVFEKKQKELESATTPEEKTRLQDELEEAKDKARRRSIGNIKFIGELFKLKMLTEAIMHDCVVKLLKNHDEESLECLCRLLTTIGKDLDFEKAKPRMDQYFNQMEKIVKERKTSSRIRFMLQDVIELRLCNWISRRADQGPKTIEQIHKEAKFEEQEEQRKVQQLITKEKRRPGVQRVDDGGWNTVQGAKNRVLDPSKFMKITKPTIDEKIQLVPKAQLGSWGKGSSGGAKASETDSLRPNATNLNRFSALQQPASTMSSSPATSDFDSRRALTSRGSTGREKNDKPLQSSTSRPSTFLRGSSSKELLDNQSQEEQRREMLETVKQITGSAEVDRSKATETAAKLDVPSGPEQDKPLFTVEEMERKSRAIIDEFLHINDYKEAMQCVEELNAQNLLHIFVRIGVESTLERSQITRDHMGQLLYQLVQSGKLGKQDFFKGILETLEVADDMAIDVPHIWLYLAELVTPMLKEGGISMRELMIELSKPLLPVGRAGILLSEILHLLCKQMSHKKVGALWREAGLNWKNFLPEGEDERNFVKEKKLDFTVSDCCSPSEALSKKELTAEELDKRLEKLVIEEKANDEQIFDWVEANLDEFQMSSPTFLRALMTAVCTAAIIGDCSSFRVDTAIIKQRVPVLLKYLDSDTERELQALYALQALIVKLDQPPNLLRMFFDCLYDEEVISEDAFYKWESSKDPAEQNGKGVALKSVTAFFTWLREAEEESEDN
ncbi:eukaryotic translation initiation factor 4 gamma 3 isoform X5 [Microcaecilia unicolor]|uniref:Eukaryotic translation initiation factor 4 gamma 3 isoform X5 n=1 Tax=Microcaecilia unicolor TaxID=1415580 RepID=A0A6P7ZV72_9AMPH|nr:eukaryotic translation initiation factor 4 gamma 3 isoform X5 [Microcaecilia unicolor]